VDVGIGLFVTTLDDAPWLTRYQRVFLWEGVSYPQEPVYYCLDNAPVFQLCSGDPLLAGFLPKETGFNHTTWSQLVVTNDGLQAFDSGTLDLPGVVERILLTQDRWVAFWLVHCDQWHLSGECTPSAVAETMRSHAQLRDAADGFLFWGSRKA
jgi:hypothetical protein